MNKSELEKNVLDLSYQRNLQILNSILIIMGGGFIAYLAALITDLSNIAQYTTLLVILGTILVIVYFKTDRTFRGISNRIRNLK